MLDRSAGHKDDDIVKPSQVLVVEPEFLGDMLLPVAENQQRLADRCRKAGLIEKSNCRLRCHQYPLLLCGFDESLVQHASLSIGQFKAHGVGQGRRNIHHMGSAQSGTSKEGRP